MTVNWQTEVNNLNLGNLTAHFTDGQTPVMGSGYGPGFFVGKPFASSTMAVCTMLQWILENTGFTIELEYRFTAATSWFKVYFYDSQNLDGQGNRILWREYGPFSVTGRGCESGDQIMIHGLLGRKLFKLVGEWAESVIAA